MIFDFLGYQTASAVLEAGVTAVTVAVPVGWLAAMPSSASGVGTVTLRCWEGDKTSFFGATTKPLTVTAPASAGPDVGTVSVGAAFDGGRGDVSGGRLRGVCAGQKRVQRGNQRRGGQVWRGIAAYSISGGGYSGNKKTLQSGLLAAAGAQTITFKVVDTRGLSAVKTLRIDVAAYTAPPGDGVDRRGAWMRAARRTHGARGASGGQRTRSARWAGEIR